MNRLIISLLLFLVLVNVSYAATIQGTIYDFSLNKISNAIIEINTEPAQREIAKTGSYSFNVPKGNYLITAKNQENQLITKEEITINEEGTYNLDLIAFADLTEEEILTNDTAPISTELDTLENKGYTWIVVAVIILIILFLIYYKKFKKKEIKEEADDLSEKVLEIIKKENGRITQKDLRKLLPYSEAKISLIITELESKGKIEKIKKGRGNILLLNKN